MKLQWYPGHMTKARREMQKDLQLVDLLIELLDARIPMSSRNPDIDRLAANKYRMILLNKADLADAKTTDAWVQYFAERGITAVPLDSRERTKMRTTEDAVKVICREKFERDRRRGILNRPVRAMVAGIPNVGKSTFINSFAGKASLKTGNKPGVTKANQWIRMNASVELLDTPGILWPKFEDETVGEHLAFIGSINDDIIDTEELCHAFLQDISERNRGAVEERYHVSFCDDLHVLMEQIAVQRNLLKKGAVPDTEKAAAAVIDDFRSGKLGRISLEIPENYGN